MLKVGIFTPYVRNEITLAAVQLADWLYKCGIAVSLLAEDRIEKGIHKYWDLRVQRARKNAIYKWAYNTTHLCWFKANPAVLQHSRLVTFDNHKQKTKNIFIPNWVDWDEHSDAFLMQADKTLCFGRDFYLWLKQFRTDGKLGTSERSYASLTTADRVLLAKRFDKNKLGLLIVLPKAVELDFDESLIDVFADLLEYHTRLHVTIISEKSLPKTFRRKVNKLKQTYASRVRYVYSIPYYEYLQEAKKHEWIYVANTRHAFGSIFPLFLASTVPIVCHDVPPAGSFVGDKVNGKLISCSLLSKPYPIADVDLNKVLTALHETLETSANGLKSLQMSGLALLAQKQSTFERFIYKEFVDYDGTTKVR